MDFVMWFIHGVPNGQRQVLGAQPTACNIQMGIMGVQTFFEWHWGILMEKNTKNTLLKLKRWEPKPGWFRAWNLQNSSGRDVSVNSIELFDLMSIRCVHRVAYVNECWCKSKLRHHPSWELMPSLDWCPFATFCIN